MIRKAMLLSAGRGLRLRPLTDRIPKPLLTVQGKSFIVRHLEALARAGIREIVVNLHHLGEQIQQALGDGQAFGVQIHYSPEDPVLETGGGVLKALPLLKDDGDTPFMVISSDILTDFDFKTLTMPVGSLLHLVMVDNPPHHLKGDYALINGRLFTPDDCFVQGIAQPALFNFGGIGLYHPALFKACPDGSFPLNHIFKKALLNGQATGQHYAGFWHNVGTIEQLRALNQTGTSN